MTPDRLPTRDELCAPPSSRDVTCTVVKRKRKKKEGGTAEFVDRSVTAYRGARERTQVKRIEPVKRRCCGREKVCGSRALPMESFVSQRRRLQLGLPLTSTGFCPFSLDVSLRPRTFNQANDPSAFFSLSFSSTHKVGSTKVAIKPFP